MSYLQNNINTYLTRYPQEVDNIKLHQNLKGIQVIRKNNYLELWEDNIIKDSTQRGAYYPVEEYPYVPKISIVEGLGFGNRLLEVLDFYNKNKKPINILIVIEPSYERFITACEFNDFRTLFQQENVFWYIGKPVTTVYEDLYNKFFDLFLSRNRNNLGFFSHPFISKVEREYFQYIRKEIKQASDLMYSSFGSQEDCFLGIKNTIKNIDNINKTPGFNNFKDKFKNKPAVVVATGPSLIKSIPKLKKIQDKCVIFAADASLKILLKHGIVPHFVGTLERDDDTAEFFKDLKFPDNRRPTLVYFPLCPKLTVDTYTGPKSVIYRNYNYYNYFQDVSPKGIIQCGHSVAHMCVKLADVAGCSKIILIGQDLAYDPNEMSTHAEGAAYGRSFKTKEDFAKFFIEKNYGNLHEVEGLHGKKYYTHDIFIYFNREFISEQKQTKAQIINSTEEGLIIPEVPWVKFEEATKDFQNLKNVFEIIQNNLNLENTKVEIETLLNELNSRHSNLQKDIRKIKDLSTLKPKKIRSGLRKIENKKIEKYYQDKLTCGYIIESDSKLLIGIENEYNLLDINKDENLLKAIELQIKWFTEAARIGKEVIENIQAGLNEKDL